MTGPIAEVDWHLLDEYVTIARNFSNAHGLGVSELEALPRETMWFGLHIRTQPDGQEVWLVRMAFNWRILETHPRACSYDRYWCYPGTGMATFIVALNHALNYGDGEPDGWIKAWGDRHPRLAGITANSP